LQNVYEEMEAGPGLWVAVARDANLYGELRHHWDILKINYFLVLPADCMWYTRVGET
jgi:hypothetical protein